MALRIRHARRNDLSVLRDCDLIDPHQSFGMEKDISLIAEYEGRTVGHLALRPMMYAHSFRMSPDPIIPIRVIADSLFRYADGFTTHALEFARPGEFAAHGTLFHVARGNGRMERFIQSKGCVTEPDSLIYRWDTLL